MVRAPVAGRVKTRLARTIGVAEAVRFYRTTARTVIARLAGAPFWQIILAVAPDDAVAARAWPAHLTRMPQGGGDIGQRMHRPMRQLPPGPVCVVGTDVPGITIADVRAAFQGLGRAAMAFGPAEDGGFWLVGARRRPRVIAAYANVRWSSGDTLADVLGNLEGSCIALTTTLSDVDDKHDHARERAAAGRLVRTRGAIVHPSCRPARHP